MAASDGTRPAAIDPVFPPPNPDAPLPETDLPDEEDRRAVSEPGAPVIIGVSFDRYVLAQQYLLAMGGLREAGSLELKDAVLVRKEESGAVKVVETMDPTPGRAALTGAMWTGLLGLILGGPVGWLAGLGIGAASGAVTAKIVDLGIPDEWVDWFRDAVEPGTSTVVILAERLHLPALVAEAKRFPGANVVYTSLPDDAFEQLSAAFES